VCHLRYRVGQCSPNLRSKLHGINDFERIKDDQDLHVLLEEIRNVSFNLQPNKNPFLMVFEALHRLFHMRQRDEHSPIDLQDDIMAMKGVLRHLGVELSTNPHLVEHTMREKGIDPIRPWLNNSLQAKPKQLNDSMPCSYA